MALFIQANPVIFAKNRRTNQPKVNHYSADETQQQAVRPVTFARDFYKVFNGAMANK
tara:strand:- start:522 stop:692 length:171 start_codon:yes stop_codon:yes gene_type:complete